jgi:hypothetical protein
MPIVQEDLWKNPGSPGMIVVSCHATIEPDGRLNMQYGEACEAARRIPGLEEQCAEAILSKAKRGVYGFIQVRPFNKEHKIIGFGLFQSRLSITHEAEPRLIERSMDELRHYTYSHPDLRVRMNMPGAAEEGLQADDILPILVPLPPNVTVCYHGALNSAPSYGGYGLKDLFLQVERWLQEGQRLRAVEYLMAQGYDGKTAEQQVDAVQELMR